MKSIYPILSIICLLLVSCGTQHEQKSESVREQIKAFPERAADMSIYEVNIRQYTPEGTFQAFIPHIQRLSKMGVDILWIMPIQPIGVKNRKGPLGSPYSIQNYTEVNADCGTIEDFKKLVTEAHQNDMLVILDWVANHTAWDHDWMDSKPDYYTTDDDGNVIPPVPDWSDVADLNYDNTEMRQEMIDALKFWIKETDLDGYRCDVAGEVPMSFWNTAKAELNKVKDLFMLAEGDEPFLHDTAFLMTYGWGFHHVLNGVAKGEQNADSIDLFLQNDLKRYGTEAIRMNFTTNHDENSWNGTVFERLGDGALALSVIASTVQGMPLIYSGQEAGLDRRLSFFDKDSIDWTDIKYEKFYAKLLRLKKDNPALWNGAYGGIPTRVSSDDKVYAFKRSKDNNTVICIVNISDQPQDFNLSDKSIEGTYVDYFVGQKYTLQVGEKLTLQPWQYLIFTNK